MKLRNGFSFTSTLRSRRLRSFSRRLRRYLTSYSPAPTALEGPVLRRSVRIHYNYSPDHALRCTITGEPLQILPKPYRPGEIELCIGTADCDKDGGSSARLRLRSLLHKLVNNGMLMFKVLRTLANGYLPNRVFGQSSLRQIHNVSSTRPRDGTRWKGGAIGRAVFEPLSFEQFVNLDIPPREMLLQPILPEKSLSMLYAPRGIGKTLLALSIGLTVAGGANLLRWSAPRSRRVLYVDGEMTVADLQHRLVQIAVGLGRENPNDAFRIVAADGTEKGINLATQEGQEGIEHVLDGTDLLILDNVSTLFPSGGESASDAWLPMQNWLLKLRRRGVSVLFVHHAGTNGRQRGTSRREDVLAAVIALRRPENYSPDQGAQFEVHFEKLRRRLCYWKIQASGCRV